MVQLDNQVICDCVHLVAERLPVEYQSVTKIIPARHRNSSTAPGSPTKPFRYFVHCGAGASDVVRIEVQAFHDGYFRPGNRGADDVPPGFSAPSWYPWPMVRTSVDVPRLVEHLRIDKGWGNHIEQSEDAGRYLCEYTYYISLAEAIESDRDMPLVLFVHVPPSGGPYSDSELAQIVRDILEWLHITYD